MQTDLTLGMCGLRAKQNNLSSPEGTSQPLNQLSNQNNQADKESEEKEKVPKNEQTLKNFKKDTFANCSSKKDHIKINTESAKTNVNSIQPNHTTKSVTNSPNKRNENTTTKIGRINYSVIAKQPPFFNKQLLKPEKKTVDKKSPIIEECTSVKDQCKASERQIKPSIKTSKNEIDEKRISSSPSSKNSSPSSSNHVIQIFNSTSQETEAKDSPNCNSSCQIMPSNDTPKIKICSKHCSRKDSRGSLKNNSSEESFPVNRIKPKKKVSIKSSVQPKKSESITSISSASIIDLVSGLNEQSPDGIKRYTYSSPKVRKLEQLNKAKEKINRLLLKKSYESDEIKYKKCFSPNINNCQKDSNDENLTLNRLKEGKICCDDNLSFVPEAPSKARKQRPKHDPYNFYLHFQRKEKLKKKNINEEENIPDVEDQSSSDVDEEMNEPMVVTKRHSRRNESVNNSYDFNKRKFASDDSIYYDVDEGKSSNNSSLRPPSKGLKRVSYASFREPSPPRRRRKRSLSSTASINRIRKLENRQLKRKLNRLRRLKARRSISKLTRISRLSRLSQVPSSLKTINSELIRRARSRDRRRNMQVRKLSAMLTNMRNKQRRNSNRRIFRELEQIMQKLDERQHERYNEHLRNKMMKSESQTASVLSDIKSVLNKLLVKSSEKKSTAKSSSSSAELGNILKHLLDRSINAKREESHSRTREDAKAAMKKLITKITHKVVSRMEQRNKNLPGPQKEIDPNKILKAAKAVQKHLKSFMMQRRGRVDDLFSDYGRGPSRNSLDELFLNAYNRGLYQRGLNEQLRPIMQVPYSMAAPPPASVHMPPAPVHIPVIPSYAHHRPVLTEGDLLYANPSRDSSRKSGYRGMNYPNFSSVHSLPHWRRPSLFSQKYLIPRLAPPRPLPLLKASRHPILSASCLRNLRSPLLKRRI
ncbi:hypothetical protein HELRODRAFT_194415 [Helobdella robusta]|uniref:Uncharacterized protein n=1 Tax=Helobdella robusta TaxID=6412 RepID=T1FW12_HELRO|nr:hypothetical protein HELRODRAFT_194415 [Helobdella robusta]ESN92025.1 hypothetical protein HELRODRAFT_194415 [Helobdella robusta]